MKKPGSSSMRPASTSIATPRSGRGWATGSRRHSPTLAVALAWQLHWGRRFHDPVDLDLASRRLRALALLGVGDIGGRSLALGALARHAGSGGRRERAWRCLTAWRLWRAWGSRLPAG